MIYMDNAATSWPKPPEVLKVIANVLEQAGGNPGRSGHRLSIAAARVVYDTREDIAQLVNCPDPLRVIFTENATCALNLGIYGLLKKGDRVVTSAMEHNSVMRPLRDLEQKGVNLTVVPCASNGTLNLKEFAQAVTPGTRLVAIVHASNVTGTIMPIEDVAKIAHHTGALLMVDAAQSAGVLPIDIQAMGIDLLAFTGHKGPLGPTGTGTLVIGKNVDTSQMTPLVRGGTGSQSEKQEQPEFLPDKFESGTPNVVGIAGLGAGIRFVMKKGVASIWEHEKSLIKALREGLANIQRVKVYGCQNPEESVGIISFTIKDKTVSEIGQRLDEEFGILTRVGLHCAPAAHQTIGTFPEGTVRLASGVFTTMDEIQQTLKAIERITRS
jgi:cysteine desulfurase/selenocysteine lyase